MKTATNVKALTPREIAAMRARYLAPANPENALLLLAVLFMLLGVFAFACAIFAHGLHEYLWAWLVKCL